MRMSSMPAASTAAARMTTNPVVYRIFATSGAAGRAVVAPLAAAVATARVSCLARWHAAGGVAAVGVLDSQRRGVIVGRRRP